MFNGINKMLTTYLLRRPTLLSPLECGNPRKYRLKLARYHTIINSSHNIKKNLNLIVMYVNVTTNIFVCVFAKNKK